ncbi:hypothetical protein KY289_036224 [Solanum tuberosum]|nr:hypothetical protein KY289_036224 [Solanum tuberosum]
MAKYSCCEVVKTIEDCVETGQLDRSTRDQLEYASNLLNNLQCYLYGLEKVNSQNWVCAQLNPLIDEVCDGFWEILGLLKNQGLTSETVKMISEVLKMIKPEIIAERINPSKQSTSSSTRMITMDMDLFTLAEDISETAAYLSILCCETYDQYSAHVSAPECPIWDRHDVNPGPDFESKISKMLERINPIRPEWRKLYISVLKSSHSSVPKAPLMHGGFKNLSHDLDLDLDLAQKFTKSIRYVLEKLKSHDASLKVAFSDRFELLQDGLLHLSEFHMILTHHKDIQRQDLSSLLSFLEFNYLKVEISLFQKLRLPKSQMDCFQEEWTSMIMFLMDSLEQCKVQIQLTDVLTLVLSVTTEAEKAIRQICPFISVSSTPVLPVIYPLNFLPTYVEAISSYFTLLKSIKTLASSGSPTMDEVFMGFHEYIFENLLLKVEADLELTDTDKVKRFYHRLLPLVTLLVDRLIQYIECKKQNDLLNKIGTLAIQAEAAIRLSYEDALDRSKCRKVNILLQLLTVSFKLIKYEGRLMDHLKHKAILETEYLDLVANAHEEIIFLRGFLATLISTYESFVEGSSTGEISDFLQETEFIEERELMNKINLLHFQLLLKFKFIKAAIRQICPSFSASSTPDHHVIYPLNFLPTYFGAIDSYFTKLKSSSDSPKTDEVLLRFHEYIFENLLLKDEADQKLTDSDKLKGFYHSLLLLVTLLSDPPIQYIECKKQNNLLWEIGTLAIKAEAAIHLSYEDSSQSNKSRKVNLLLQLLTVAFMLIRCEGKLTDQLKHKAILETEFLNLVENAYEELIFLRIFLIDLLGQQTIELNKSDGLLMHAEVAAHKATLISTCSYESFVDGSSSRDMSLSLSDFLKETKSVNAEIRELCFQLLDESASYITVTDLKCFINMLLDMLNHLQSWDDVIPVNSKTLWNVFKMLPIGKSMSFSSLSVVTGLNFPKTNGLGFLNCFLGKLEELLHSKLDLITKLKPQIVLVKEGLLILRSFFNHTEETYDENDEICGLIISATEMAYEAECCENLKREKIDVNRVAKGSAYIVPSLSANTSGANEEMVGFQDVMDKLKKQLLGGSH